MSSGSASWIFERGSWAFDPLIRLLFPGGESRSRKFALDWLTAARPRRLLEVGVGSGSNLPFYPLETRCVGIDASPAMVRRARRRRERVDAGRVELQLARAEQLPFSADSFDAVLLFLFLSQLVPHRAVLAEVERVAAPGATILIVDHLPSMGSAGRLLESAGDLLLRPLGLSMRVDIRSFLAERGWRVLEDVACPGTLSFLRLLVVGTDR